MALIKNEIYNDNGLVEVRYIEAEGVLQTQEELISDKENELLKVYDELKQLKDNMNQTN